MENLMIDLGAVEYRIPGGGSVRFNPTDPNVYSRFLGLEEELAVLQKNIQQEAKLCSSGSQVLQMLESADKALKASLNRVFPGNNFHEALGCVNLLAQAGDKTVAESLLSALEQVLSDGAKRLAGKEAEALLQG